jgi:integrase
MSANKLTDTAIQAAIAKGKPAKLFDGEGLFLQIPERPKAAAGSTSSRSPTWRQKYRFDGKEKLISHGVYPRVSLKNARQRLRRAKELLEEGVDPSAHRKAEKTARRGATASTFEAVTREWFAKRSKSWAPTNSEKIIGRLEKDAFPWIGSSPISKLTREQVLACLRRVEERGALESARRVRQYIHSVFEYATHAGIAALQHNPTPPPGALASPEPGKFASVTDPRQVGALIRAIRGYQGSLVSRIALQLAPLVFVRPGELREAEWKEFDLKGAEWRIPAERMKMRTTHVVPLSDQAVALLEELKPLTGHGRYVFPSERTLARPMSANTLTAALRSLGYDSTQMTVHGFRHMASTLLNESGKWRGDAIERQMAHMPRDQVRAVYNAAEYLPDRRRMMDWWANHLDTLAADHNKIVSIKTRR